MRTEKTILLYQVQVYAGRLEDGLCIFLDNKVEYDLDLFDYTFTTSENVISIFDEDVYKGRVFYGSKDWQNEVKTFSF